MDISTQAVVVVAVALVLWIARIVVFARLHTMRPAAHMVTDTVSDYANGTTGRMFRVMSVITACAWVATALAVLIALPEWDYRFWCFGILLVAAITPLLMIAAPVPPQGKPLGAQGLIHYALAIVNFAAAYSPTDRIAGMVQGVAAHGGSSALLVVGGSVLAVLQVVILVGLIALIVSMVLPKARRLMGLTERVFLWAVVLFYALFTAVLLFG